MNTRYYGGNESLQILNTYENIKNKKIHMSGYQANQGKMKEKL